MPPPRLHPPPFHPYRLFHLSARLRLRDRPSPSSQAPPEDDYYSLLLSSPIPDPAKKTINPARAPKSTNPTSSTATPPPSTASAVQSAPASIIQGSDKGPDNRVLFSTPLAGPSARMRGLARGERGLARPPEPDNCCMSGCVNCVWDAYREEVEEWAKARRRGDREQAESGRRRVGSGEEGRVRGIGVGGGEDGGGAGDLDEVGGLRGMDLDGGHEAALFEGVPVGIREFMNTEKRLRERRAAESAG